MFCLALSREVLTLRQLLLQFDENPALDVPPSTQAVNKSVLANGSARPHERRDSDSSNSSAGASKCCRA